VEEGKLKEIHLKNALEELEPGATPQEQIENTAKEIADAMLKALLYLGQRPGGQEAVALIVSNDSLAEANILSLLTYKSVYMSSGELYSPPASPQRMVLKAFISPRNINGAQRERYTANSAMRPGDLLPT
jgi:hypothetical protein